MHMADALVSPAVGGTLWAVSGGLIAFCARKVKQSAQDKLVPMMGVLGAFTFAAQMINFSIPGTGSSGHLGGGLILAVLLGPHAAFLVIASVLAVQAFFFADGGLLALGCNIFNLGFFPAFVAYPLIYRVLARDQHGTPRAWLAAMTAAVAGLLLGALSVVLETSASGISALPFRAFLLIMLPIHLAIGVVEGLATVAVVSFIARARPETLCTVSAGTDSTRFRPVLAGLLVAAIVTGGFVSWFASTYPDGLERAVARIRGNNEVAAPANGIHESVAGLQEKTAVLPGYGFKPEGSGPESRSAERAGTSVSGIAGGLMTLVLVCVAGLVLKAGSTRGAREKRTGLSPSLHQ